MNGTFTSTNDDEFESRWENTEVIFLIYFYDYAFLARRKESQNPQWTESEREAAAHKTPLI